MECFGFVQQSARERSICRLERQYARGSTARGHPVRNLRKRLERRPLQHSGAFWIWAPGITGDTPNASLAEYAFSRKFDLAGTPISGSISVAVDDMAQVYVNGSLAGTTGSITNASVAFAAQSALKSFDITPFLVSGTNTIEVLAQNGPDSFAGVTNSDYRQNTAGVVFGGTITFQSVPEPSSIALLGLGSFGILLYGRKRRRGNSGVLVHDNTLPPARQAHFDAAPHFELATQADE